VAGRGCWGWLKRTAALLAESSCYMTLDVGVRQDGQAEQPWRMHSTGVRSSRANRAGDGGETSSFAAAAFAAHYGCCSLRGGRWNAEAVVGQLVEAHYAIVGDWFEVTMFLNLGPRNSIREMLKGDSENLRRGRGC
jgi:hypothetical protein